MILKIFETNFNLYLLIVVYLSIGNNVSSSPQNLLGQNVYYPVKSPSSLHSQYKNLLSLTPQQNDESLRSHTQQNIRESSFLKRLTPTPLLRIPLQNNNEVPLVDYYQVSTPQYYSPIQKYTIPALRDYNQDLITQYYPSLSQRFNHDSYGQYNPLLEQPLPQTYPQSLPKLQGYSRLKDFIPQYQEPVSHNEKNERLNELIQQYLQPETTLALQRCLDQTTIPYNVRRGFLGKDYGRVPHVAPRKNPKPSLENQFGNPSVVKPLKENSKDLRKQGDNVKPGRRSDFQVGKYGKHVVPKYTNPQKKYANPFKSTVIVSPEKENQIVDPDANEQATDKAQYNPVNQSSSNEFPNIFSWLWRKRRSIPTTESRNNYITINRKNAGVDLLKLRKQKNLHREDERTSLIRRAIRSLLQLQFVTEK